VFDLARDISNNNLEEKSSKEPQVRQNSDVEIFFDDKLLSVEKRKDHRDCDSRSIIECVEQRSREKNFIFHPS